MAKTRTTQFNNVMLQGVSNYDKLKTLKNNDFNKYNPFLSQTFSNKAKQQHEAESLDVRYLDEDIYTQMLMMNGLNQNRRTGNRNSYYNLSKKHKRLQLQRMSNHDLIDEVLTKLCDEIVVTSNDEDPVKLVINKEKLEKAKIKQDVIDAVIKYGKEEFRRIINMYGFNQEGSETSLWNKLYLFLTEGSQSYELVWDNIQNAKKLIAIHEIDSLETEEFYLRGIKFWKHHKLLSRNEEYVILYDTQVVKIDWASASPNNRMSYLEHLIKAFNDLRILDEATITWTLTNSVYRMLFKVPTKGKSRIQAAQSIAQEKHRYNDEVSYDSMTGEVSINGSPNLQMMKSYWMGQGDSGEPEITSIGNEGPDLKDMERNEYFQRRFYRAAKLPYSRFDSSGSSWNIDTRSQLREEINFGRFVSRIRSIIEILYLKPLYLSIVARFPEFKDDDALQAFTIQWNSYNVFEELMELDILNEKIDAISKLSEATKIQLPDNSGEMHLLAMKWLLKRYVKEIDDDAFTENEKELRVQNTNLFKYQMELARLQAKYDPEVNLDQMGIPDTDKITSRVENDIDAYEYPEFSSMDDENEETETTSDDIETKQDEIDREEEKLKEEEEKLSKQNNVENKTNKNNE